MSIVFIFFCEDIGRVNVTRYMLDVNELTLYAFFCEDIGRVNVTHYILELTLYAFSHAVLADLYMS